jgi:hypothetical protein
LLQEQKLGKTQRKLEEAQSLQLTYRKVLRQLNADQSIVSKDIADLDQACKRAEKKVLSLHKELKQRAAENNSAMPATTAALQVLGELRCVLSLDVHVCGEEHFSDEP